MHSDLNTTLVLAIITVISFLGISFKYVWKVKTVKSYLFNFKWANTTEKFINVFVWWLHLIWIPATVASLSLRLFGNIFAWIVLIWVITYLWAVMTESFHLLETWRLLSVPFWFFEVFVAFIQAAVFGWLMIAYFSQNKAEH
jgi:F-type H+-transporting ATPase subunit a